jgi:hypothetical protein
MTTPIPTTTNTPILLDIINNIAMQQQNCVNLVKLRNELEPIIVNDPDNLNAIKQVLRDNNIDFSEDDFINTYAYCESTNIQLAKNKIEINDECKQAFLDYATRYCTNIFKDKNTLAAINRERQQKYNTIPYPNNIIYQKQYDSINTCINEEKKPLIEDITQENTSNMNTICTINNLIDSNKIKNDKFKAAISMITNNIPNPKCENITMENNFSYNNYLNCVNLALSDQTNILNICGLKNRNINQINKLSSIQECEIKTEETSDDTTPSNITPNIPTLNIPTPNIRSNIILPIDITPKPNPKPIEKDTKSKSLNSKTIIIVVIIIVIIIIIIIIIILVIYKNKKQKIY